MKIKLNGEKITINLGCSAAQLLQQKFYVSSDIALAINGKFLPRSEYASYQLKADDQVGSFKLRCKEVNDVRYF